MNVEILRSLEHVCWALGTLFAILSAWFKVRSVWFSNQEDRESLKAEYRTKWEKLRSGRYLELPERGVKWLLNKKRKPSELLARCVTYFIRFFDTGKQWIFTLLLGMPGVIATFFLGPSFGITSLIVILIICMFFRAKTSSAIQLRIGYLYGIFLLVSCSLILKLALTLEIYWTTIITFLIAPIYMVMFSGCMFFVPGIIKKHLFTEDEVINLGLSFGLSFFITSFTLLIGSFFSPSAFIPQTTQMFLINVFFDGITVILTFIILEGAINKKYSIPVAIVTDIIVAAILACLSLYFGLLGSDNAISFTDAINVLIARDPLGAKFVMGPYFWVMHTTFIPTAVYITLIVLAYIGKLIILPVFQVLKKGHELENPHELTVAVFGFVAISFAGIAGLLNRINSPLPVGSL